MTKHAVIKRHPERAVPDEALDILSTGYVAHLGFSQGDQPFVIPLTYHFDATAPDRLYLHGSNASRSLRHLAAGAQACVTVTLVDGLVYSRDAMDHSMNYRSVVCFGRARSISDISEKGALFEGMIKRYHPGRTAGRDYSPPTSEQLAGTAVVEVIIEEMSAKARRGGPKGPRDSEMDAPGTCGVIALGAATGQMRETGETANSANISLRKAVREDAPAIAEVLYRAFREYEASYTQEAFAATPPTPERVRQRMLEGPIWVAEQNNIIVGTVSAVLEVQGVYIRSMAVLPGARGRGVGRLLLREAESYAIENRASRLFLSTTPFLSRAIALYESFGFRRNTDGPHDLFGTRLFTMVKSLGINQS